jgi:threonine dehydratase
MATRVQRGIRIIIPERKTFEEAARRIRGFVRYTPILNASSKHQDFLRLRSTNLLFKLENLQITGSFKARGAANKVLSLTKSKQRAGLITASGGNHGIAVAWAAKSINVPAVVYLPKSTSPDKTSKLKSYGAEVFIEGSTWDDANTKALEAARKNGLTYIHPFADPMVIAGQGTIGLEIMEQAGNVDTILVAIGGGGLVSGIAAAAKSINPAVRIIGVEPTGAPTLYESLKTGEIVTLPEIKTDAGTLAPRRTMPMNYEIIAATLDKIILVSDEEMREAAYMLWHQFGIAVELSGAATLSALMTARYAPGPNETVVAVICGKGSAGF